jgi:hypothetical protein
VKDTSTQLTSSLVTELEAGAGSTTAAGNTSSRPDELHQEKQHSLDQQSSNTQEQHNFLHSITQTQRNLQQNHDDGLKLKTKPRRRRTSDQQQVQEEKDKPRS